MQDLDHQQYFKLGLDCKAEHECILRQAVLVSSFAASVRCSLAACNVTLFYIYRTVRLLGESSIPFSSTEALSDSAVKPRTLI